MTIRQSFRDTTRQAAFLAGAIVTAALLIMFFFEYTGIWRPLGLSFLWLIALVPALIWTVYFGTTRTNDVVVDDEGVGTGRGNQLRRVRWDDVAGFVEFPTKQHHLAVLSRELPIDRAPGDNGMIRAYRLPNNGVVFQADDELRAALAERLGPPKAVRDVVGL